MTIPFLHNMIKILEATAHSIALSGHPLYTAPRHVTHGDCQSQQTLVPLDFTVVDTVLAVFRLFCCMKNLTLYATYKCFSFHKQKNTLMIEEPGKTRRKCAPEK